MRALISYYKLIQQITSNFKLSKLAYSMKYLYAISIHYVPLDYYVSS